MEEMNEEIMQDFDPTLIPSDLNGSFPDPLGPGLLEEDHSIDRHELATNTTISRMSRLLVGESVFIVLICQIGQFCRCQINSRGHSPRQAE